MGVARPSNKTTAVMPALIKFVMAHRCDAQVPGNRARSRCGRIATGQILIPLFSRDAAEKKMEISVPVGG
jgi:hypothetical protein